MVVESSTVGDSHANGVVERAIKSVQGQIQASRSAFEDHIKAKVGPDCPAWMCEYVLLNRFNVGKDEMTALERNTRKKAKTLGMEFGEGVLWKR